METISFILYHDSIHLAISVLIGLLLVRIYKSRAVFIVSILSGILIDSDHLFDLALAYLNTIGPVFNAQKVIGLFNTQYMVDTGKVYVLFHSLDLIWVWWIIGKWLNNVFRTRGLQWALLLPMLAHILVDYASYTPNPLAYFLFFRFWHNFSSDSYQGL